MYHVYTYFYAFKSPLITIELSMKHLFYSSKFSFQSIHSLHELHHLILYGIRIATSLTVRVRLLLHKLLIYILCIKSVQNQFKAIKSFQIID